MKEETLQKIFISLGRIESNVSITRDDIREVKEKIDAHCKRINLLERSQSKTEGKATILGAISAIIVSAVVMIFKD